MIKNNTVSYGWLARFFHWLVFTMFVLLYLLANIMGDMPKDAAPILGMGKYDMYALHKSIGITVILVALLRLSWRLLNPTPHYPATMPRLQVWAAHGAHAALYAAMLLMPLSGYVMSMAGGHGISWFGVVELPNIIGINKPLGGVAHTVHEVCGNLIYLLVGVHVAAALYHHFVKKDTIMKRMFRTVN